MVSSATYYLELHIAIAFAKNVSFYQALWSFIVLTWMHDTIGLV
jgi:hypothetical protein